MTAALRGYSVAKYSETAFGAAFLRAQTELAARPQPALLTTVNTGPPPEPVLVPEPVFTPPPVFVAPVLVHATLIPAAARRQVTPPSPEELLARALEAIRDRVQRNIPKHRDPERFHEEKSEIAGDLSRLVSDLRKGRASPRGRAATQG